MNLFKLVLTILVFQSFNLLAMNKFSQSLIKNCSINAKNKLKRPLVTSKVLAGKILDYSRLTSEEIKYKHLQSKLDKRNANSAALLLLLVKDDQYKKLIDASMFKAIVDQDISKIKLIMKLNNSFAEIQQIKDWSLNTVLTEAIKKECFDLVKELIKDGPNVNAKDSCGWTPLHIACDYRREKIIKILLENGASIEAKNNSYETPLHYACMNNQEKIVNILLKHGANIEAKDNEGCTPLYRAIFSEKVVKLLLKNRANIEAKCFEGKTPFALGL